jgi:hypothetical protein
MEYNDHMTDIVNPERYLERMSKPLQEKLKIAKYIPREAKTVLDVGCADGTVLFCPSRVLYIRRRNLNHCQSTIWIAHEALNRGGRMIIRDMILYDYASRSELWVDEMKEKVRSRKEFPLYDDFEKFLSDRYSEATNHFLLKYMYWIIGKRRKRKLRASFI